MKNLIARSRHCSIQLRYLAADISVPEIAEALKVLARLLDGIIGNMEKEVKRRH